MSYDTNNIFAKILRGEIPCHKVFEDDVALAFMDVMPQVDGHTLVLPKAASRNILDMTPQNLAALITRVQHVAKSVKLAFKADGLQIRQYNEPAAGQTVFHTHFHILPMLEGVGLKRHAGEMEKPEILKANAEKVRAALG